MTKLPYFRFFPKDFESDEAVRLMNDAELGLYIRCLCYSWINDGLPGTPDEIRRVIRIESSDFASLWPGVASCFKLIGGRYRNPRQEEERSHATKKSVLGSRAAAHGQEESPGFIYLIQRPTDDAVKIGSSVNVPKRLAQLRHKYSMPLTLLGKFAVQNMRLAELDIHRRYEKKRDNGEWFRLSKSDITRILTPSGDIEGDVVSHPHTRASESVCVSVSGSSSERGAGENHSAEPEPPPPSRSWRRRPGILESDTSGPPEFCEWWAAYPDKVGRVEAAREWISLVTTPEDQAGVLACMEAYEASDAWQRGVYERPAKWLRERSRNRWLDRPARSKVAAKQIAENERMERLGAEMAAADERRARAAKEAAR